MSKQFGGINEADNIRLCINLQKVNSKLKESIYTLPTPVEIFKMVGDVKFFTEIDLSSAYYHIKVKKDNQPLLVFAIIHFQTQGESRTILFLKRNY